MEGNGFDLLATWIFFFVVHSFVKKNPLTKKDALAAVTVPWGLTNAGFNLAICGRVETRIPLSAVTVCVRPKRRQASKSYNV